MAENGWKLYGREMPNLLALVWVCVPSGIPFMARLDRRRSVYGMGPDGPLWIRFFTGSSMECDDLHSWKYVKEPAAP